MTNNEPAPKTVCLLGADTPLGQALKDQCEQVGFRVKAITTGEWDMTNAGVLQSLLPDPCEGVLQGLSMDDIEQAESDREKAFHINSEVARLVAHT